MSLTSWREVMRSVSHRFPSCKRSRKRSVRWRVRRRMFCSRCGSELITDAKSCRVCGLTTGTKIAPLLVCWKPPNRQGSALGLPLGPALTFDEYRERKLQERRSRFRRLRNRRKRGVRRLMKSRFRSA